MWSCQQADDLVFQQGDEVEMEASYGPQCFAAFAATMGEIVRKCNGENHGWDFLFGKNGWDCHHLHLQSSPSSRLLTSFSSVKAIPTMFQIRKLGDGNLHQLDKSCSSSSSEAWRGQALNWAKNRNDFFYWSKEKYRNGDQEEKNSRKGASPCQSQNQVGWDPITIKTCVLAFEIFVFNLQSMLIPKVGSLMPIGALVGGQVGGLLMSK